MKALFIFLAFTLFGAPGTPYAQTPTAPTYTGALDGSVYFPVVNKGKNYKVTGDRVGGSGGGISPDSLNLQRVCIGGNSTTRTIISSGLLIGIAPLPTGINLANNSIAAGGTGNQDLKYYTRDAGRHVFSIIGTSFGGEVAEFAGAVRGWPAEVRPQFMTLGQFQDSLNKYLPNGVPVITSLTANAVASMQGSDRGGRIVVDNLNQPSITDPKFKVVYQYPYPTDAVVVLTGRDNFNYRILSDDRFGFEAELVGTIPNASNFKVNFLVSGW